MEGWWNVAGNSARMAVESLILYIDTLKNDQKVSKYLMSLLRVWVEPKSVISALSCLLLVHICLIIWKQVGVERAGGRQPAKTTLAHL